MAIMFWPHRVFPLCLICIVNVLLWEIFRNFYIGSLCSPRRMELDMSDMIQTHSNLPVCACIC